MSARVTGRRLGILGTGIALVALSLNPLLGGPAGAVSNPVTHIVIDSVTGDAAPPGTTGSQPTVLTAVGDKVTVKVRFLDVNDAAASFGKATDIQLSTSPSTGGDSVTPVLATDTEATLTSSAFTTAANNVKLTVSVPGLRGKNAVPAVTFGDSFDVLLSLATVNDVTSNFQRQVTKTGGSACAPVDTTNPYCATVILPLGSGPTETSPIALATGVCDNTDYTANCPASSYVVELLADLGKYSGSTPATVILDCDKKFCGHGSIQSNIPQFAVGGNANLVDLKACPAKGVAPDGGACVDYVQSTRDNAGDTHLWILFAVDSRMSCC